jgi:hypothetical protein
MIETVIHPQNAANVTEALFSQKIFYAKPVRQARIFPWLGAPKESKVHAPSVK